MSVEKIKVVQSFPETVFLSRCPRAGVWGHHPLGLCFTCPHFKRLLSLEEILERGWDTKSKYVQCFSTHKVHVQEEVTYECIECGAKFDWRYEAEYHMETHEEERLQKDIRKNLTIINKCRGSKRKIKRLRLYFAVYRLYRYLDVPPKKIASLTKMQRDRIYEIIGQTFKFICMSDSKCVFKSFFEPQPEKEED